MQKEIFFKGIPVRYSVRGEGTVLLFIHGYLESGEIWDPFLKLLEGKTKIIVPDIPGHGNSGTWGNEHSMEELAVVLNRILEEEHAEKACILGHSMGGYVAMAFAAAFPEKLSGLGLIHSTCFADSEEKKENRDREIALVKCHRKQQIILANIPRAFATDNLGNFSSEVERAKALAMKCPDEGIIALLNGMKSRIDHSGTLAKLTAPVLLTGGSKDNYIPAEVFSRLASLVPEAKIVLLRNSGHMGFIEEKEHLSQEVLSWLEMIS